MSIDRSTVTRIAHLARLHVPHAELDTLATELDGVLAFVAELGAASLEGIAPLAHPFAAQMPLREDVVHDVDRRDAFQALAPEAQSGLYLVPKVID